MSVETADLTYEEMGITLRLPTGWDLEADDSGELLVCVADDEWTDEVGYAASITVQRERPLTDDSELPELAASSLEQMRSAYEGFELLDSRTDGGRAWRRYEFVPDGLEHAVQQTQGLIADVGMWVVTGTASLAHAEALAPLFDEVVRSVRRTDG